jgi:adenylate kinase
VYIIFLGAPGAGKGTQAANVARKLDLVHIASGDLFRQAIERGNELGLKVKAYVETGMLVADEIAIQVILEPMSAPDCHNGVILDGFPRNLKQAEALDRALALQSKAIDWVVYIKVAEEELAKRLSGRWICRNCQTPYHSQSSSPRVQNRCDLCGGELYQRPDDTAETVRKRLMVYFTETAPLVDYYARMGKLLEVAGEGSVAEVGRKIMVALHEEKFITRGIQS